VSGPPTFGSLFSGIGGLDLGLEWAGWQPRWQVENDPYCQRILARHWPELTRYGDIRDVDWGAVEPVHLLAGGFPCQPFSIAGQRRGTADERWLWPEFARAVGVLRPAYVLVENVPGLVGRSGGMGDVLAGLAALGYDAEWDCLPAAAVGAPHLRYRIWILASPRWAEYGRPLADPGGGDAHAPDDVCAGRDAAVAGDATLADAQGEPERAGLRAGRSDRLGGRRSGDGGGALADPDGSRPQGRSLHPERPDQRATGASGLDDSDRSPELRGRGWGAAPSTGHAPAGADWWSVEPDVGRVADGVPSRVDRLRALGNAVVPQVARAIGERIMRGEGLGA